MRIKLLILCWILLICLSSCMSYDSLIPSTDEYRSTSTLSTSEPKIIYQPTFTFENLSTDTPTIGMVPWKTISPTVEIYFEHSITPITAGPKINFLCLDSTTDFPEFSRSVGILILENKKKITEGINEGKIKNETFLMDVSNGKLEKVTFEDENSIETQSDHIISPSHGLVAYESNIFNLVDGEVQYKGVESSLIVKDAEGKQLVSYPFMSLSDNGNWLSILKWVNNQQLLINLVPDNSNHTADDILLLNPFNGESKMLPSNYPGIYVEPPIFGWGGGRYFVTMYDPTLTRVVYPLDPEKKPYYELELWDIERKESLARLKYNGNNSSYWPPVPRWSPDGSSFVVEAAFDDLLTYELFKVDRDGKVEQLTDLNENGTAYYLNYDWAPDGKHVFIFYSTDPDRYRDTARLAVIDAITGEITDYCLEIKFKGKDYGAYPPVPIWSPNGEQFLINEWYEKDHHRVILVDLIQRTATVIAEDMEAVGWMEKSGE